MYKPGSESSTSRLAGDRLDEAESRTPLPAGRQVLPENKKGEKLSSLLDKRVLYRKTGL